jgi:hypothetical protein
MQLSYGAQKIDTKMDRNPSWEETKVYMNENDMKMRFKGKGCEVKLNQTVSLWNPVPRAY